MARDLANTGQGTGWMIFIGVSVVVSLVFPALISAFGDSTWITPVLAGYWCSRRWFYAKKVLDRTETFVPAESAFHPYPREYQKSLLEAFAAVRRVLAESVYNVSDKWRDVNADTDDKKITAGLNIHKWEGDKGKHLGLEVDFKDTESGTTIIEFKFDPRIEPEIFPQATYNIMSEYANDFLWAVGEKLGPGAKLTPAKVTRNIYKDDFSEVPAPSWWLLILTVVGILKLFHDISIHI